MKKRKETRKKKKSKLNKKRNMNMNKNNNESKNQNKNYWKSKIRKIQKYYKLVNNNDMEEEITKIRMMM